MSTPSPVRWRDSAACRGLDPELFFPDDELLTAHEQTAEAKAICSRCPVRKRCLDEALELIPHGIAGGLTEQERRSLRRRTRNLDRGLPVVASTTEAIDAANAAMAAGEDRRAVARHFGVTPRTVDRWIGSASCRSPYGNGNGQDTRSRSEVPS